MAGMRPAWLRGAVISLLFPAAVWAGERGVVEARSLSEPWEFKIGVPIWIAGFDGTVGVRSRTSRVDVSASSVLRHLNFTASLNAEVRKGRFGVYTDFLYLDAQSGTPTPGLVSRVDLKVSELLTDFDLNWRLMEGRRGWLDLLIGFRYINFSSRLGLNPDNSAIAKASEELVAAASSQVRSVLERELRGVLDGKSPNLPVPPLAAEVQEKLAAAIRRIKNDPELRAALASGNAARIEAARKNAGKEIERALKRQLSRTFTLEQWWLDPYLGLRGRYRLSSAFYLTAKADLGGFNIGSRFTWQGYGALGCQVSRYFYTELGYRYLYVDYRDNGFIYDLATHGGQLTFGLVF